MRLFVDGFGQKVALFKADVARWRADEARYGMAFHVFGHIKALQRYAQRVGKLFVGFGFAHAYRAGEEEAAYRFVGQGKAGTRHFDGGNQRVDGVFLTVNRVFQIATEELRHLFVVVRHGFFGNPRNFGDDCFDLCFADDFFLFGFGQNPLRRICFVHHVDGFVGQETLVDVACREFGGCFDCALRIADFVEGFKHRRQAAQDLCGFGYVWFDHVDFLPAAA